MKLKTLNANPSLFYDLRALVERLSNPKLYMFVDIGQNATNVDADKVIKSLMGTQADFAAEARAILEKFKKLEGG